MNAYYTQQSNEIFPIYGVSSIEEAKDFVLPELHHAIIETDESVYMNIPTGSVDFESGWDDLDGLVKVRYDANSESWVEDE